MSLSLDFTEFLTGLTELEKDIPGIGKKALVNATRQLAIDADEEKPKTPHLDGNLRGKKTIDIVDGETTSLTFEMSYAKRWHEAKDDIDPVTGKKITWSEADDGVGPEYLITKMVTNKDKYREIMGETVKEGIK